MASEEDVLLREVDEDLSRDKTLERIRRYRVPAAVGASAIVLAVAAFQFVDGQKNAKANDAALRYAELSFAAADQPTAQELTDFALRTDTGYGVLARMRAASALAQNGDAEGAAALYAEIYQNTSLSVAMQDFARVRAAYTLFDIDSAQASTIVADVQSEAFQGHAAEIAAAASLLSGNYAGAKARFDAIAASPDAEEFFRSRARSFSSLADAGANGASLETQQSSQSDVVDFIRSFGAELEGAGVPLGVDPGVDVLEEPPVGDLLEALEAEEASAATADSATEEQ
ncbi:MAG: tetratricopeptide repeat protein [Pseudomonadota bacterium]